MVSFSFNFRKLFAQWFLMLIQSSESGIEMENEIFHQPADAIGTGFQLNKGSKYLSLRLLLNIQYTYMILTLNYNFYRCIILDMNKTQMRRYIFKTIYIRICSVVN